ncbi:serine protease family S09X [Thraustotheca clavata]|uniref:Serine protease family S09X n=1 Tax=Thraustotheca clavata TaxID=74557 RepID=A0A1W0A703_9STRA|nr:serine protease family S09X [Thraustotheca clavata]
MGNAASDISIFADGEMEHEFEIHGGAGDVSVKELISQGYNMVVDSVIRPPRISYDLDELGPKSFTVHDPCTEETIHVLREDFKIRNERHLNLSCSHWRIVEDDEITVKTAPCLIYLHSNLGSRQDVLKLRDEALMVGFSVLAFDFSGSGNSDGIYVTMGWNESVDLKTVLDHVENDETVIDIVFYAHSMGGYPAMINVASRYQDKGHELAIEGAGVDAIPAPFRRNNLTTYTKSIRGMILDSAYSTMDEVTDELVMSVRQEGFQIPKMLLKSAAKFVEKSVEKRADVDLSVLRPIEFAPLCKIPALIVYGTKDQYIMPDHAKTLDSKYAGPHTTLPLDFDHYAKRPSDSYRLAILFLRMVRTKINEHQYDETLSTEYQDHIRQVKQSVFRPASA